MNRLKEMREKRGMTRRELNERSGLSFRRIILGENEDGSLRRYEYKKLAEVLECDMKDICDFTSDVNKAMLAFAREALREFDRTDGESEELIWLRKKSDSTDGGPSGSR